MGRWFSGLVLLFIVVLLCSGAFLAYHGYSLSSSVRKIRMNVHYSPLAIMVSPSDTSVVQANIGFRVHNRTHIVSVEVSFQVKESVNYTMYVILPYNVVRLKTDSIATSWTGSSGIVSQIRPSRADNYSIAGLGYLSSIIPPERGPHIVKLYLELECEDVFSIEEEERWTVQVILYGKIPETVRERFDRMERDASNVSEKINVAYVDFPLNCTLSSDTYPSPTDVFVNEEGALSYKRAVWRDLRPPGQPMRQILVCSFYSPQMQQKREGDLFFGGIYLGTGMSAIIGAVFEAFRFLSDFGLDRKHRRREDDSPQYDVIAAALSVLLLLGVSLLSKSKRHQRPAP